MNIFVTGVAGFIGFHLSERLVDLGHFVLGIDSLTESYSRAMKELNAKTLQDKGISLLPLVLAVDDLNEAVRGIDVVCHLPAQQGIAVSTTFETYVRNNIQATYRLVQTARQLPSLRGFINVATPSIFGADASGDETSEPKPIFSYGITKLAAEQLVLSYGRGQGKNHANIEKALRLLSYNPRTTPEEGLAKTVEWYRKNILDNIDF